MQERTPSTNEVLKDQIDSLDILIDSFDGTPHTEDNDMRELLIRRELLNERLQANGQAAIKQHYIKAWTTHIDELQSLFMANHTITDRREEWDRVRAELVQVVTEQADLTYKE